MIGIAGQNIRHTKFLESLADGKKERVGRILELGAPVDWVFWFTMVGWKQTKDKTITRVVTDTHLAKNLKTRDCKLTINLEYTCTPIRTLLHQASSGFARARADGDCILLLLGEPLHPRGP